MSTAPRHSWKETFRDHHKTERTCARCGMVKVTRHEPASFPPHWQEFWRAGERIEIGRTPTCIPAAAMEEGASA